MHLTIHTDAPPCKCGVEHMGWEICEPKFFSSEKYFRLECSKCKAETLFPCKTLEAEMEFDFVPEPEPAPKPKPKNICLEKVEGNVFLVDFKKNIFR